MRRLLNDGYDAVDEMLEGYVKAHSDYVSFHPNDERVIVSNKVSEEPRVRIIFGGGTGHEPLFMGYVGKDLADAAVAGNVNTSPSPEPCYNAVKAVDSGKGCLYLYGNYAGDVLNFDMGAEMAAEDGIRVETVTIKDDVMSAENFEDRRGVAGDIFVLKVAAAAAAKGYDLDKVKELAEKANRLTYSMGVALSSATLPVTGETIFHMDEGDMEVGMGIHGEPGIERKKLEPADQVVDEIMDHILADAQLKEGSEVKVLVNGLGSLPLMDQYISYRRVEQILAENGIKPYRPMVGDYATSMDMIGMSVTLVHLDDEIKELLDYSCDTPYWKEI